MASSSSRSSIPAPEAVQVLVSSLADDSSVVREASMASLNDISTLNPLLVLECCAAVSRGGRRRFGNMAGVFQVMPFGVRALDGGEVDNSFMANLAKITTAEMISSKELNSDWQRAATGVLVAIGSHLPDLMMEEIFLHVSGSNSALPAMVHTLAEFASAEPLQFIPRWKGVLSSILPLLGNVRDIHRPIFANALKCWCQAAWQYSMDFSSHSLLDDDDVMSFLNSAFELLLRVWASSRDLKVRVASVEALGQMVGLVTRTQLKAALPRLVPTMLDLNKKDQDIAFMATCCLHNLLNASLLSESGPPMLDFEDLTLILSTLLPVVYINNESKEQSDFSVGLKTYNEVQHCFLTVGLVYPDDLFMFIVNKCRLREEPLTSAALCVLKHLLPRLSESWHSKRPQLVEAVKFLLDEQNLRIRKALLELIVVMASHCYLVGSSGELFVEYLVRHAAITNEKGRDLESRKLLGSSGTYIAFPNKKPEMKIGAVTPAELRAVCEKGLLLATITIPEMEHILWPFLLKMITPRAYTGAVAMVCRCISELWRHRSYGNDMLRECKTRSDIPTIEDLFARLVVLLYDPLARGQLAIQILTVLSLLAPLFPKKINLFWQDEIPKMKAYVSDTEDLKQDPSYQDTWGDMIINFVAESLDVIQDADWLMSLGNAFSKHYELYAADDEHAAFLHRCLGMLLQKVNDRAYVRDKIDWMYQQANIAIPRNGLGLAKAIGLVAASHLDTVLEKLKDSLDNVGQNIFLRILSFFSDSFKTEESDDIHATLALMYGYAAKYAPSTVIEARINALLGTNMLSQLCHVRHPRAKQAVITAIDLLGNAVINAAESGASFPLRKRDQLLDYILILMGPDEDDDFADYHELLRTQALAISACTTLVSAEPKLTVETRNHVMKGTLGFFAIPNNPVDVVNPLVDNLITLLCAILISSGENGRSRAELLLYILRQIDQFISSPVEYQRKRGCLAVHEMLLKFRMVCISGYCALGCQGSCTHNKQIDHTLYGNFSKLPPAFVLPSREALCLGDRVVVYLPRCLDTNSEVRKISAQILDQLFSISLLLPRPAASSISAEDIELSYSALSSLDDVIAILRNDTSIDPSEVFNRIVSSLCILLSKEELIATLHGCSVAICDKIRQSAQGAIQAVIEFVSRRGKELSEIDISRTTQSLISATVHVTDKHLRLETLGAVSSLAENTSPKIVFDEVLATAGKDMVTKDISRLHGGWPMQDPFCAFSQHIGLSVLFLEHVISVLSQTPMLRRHVDRVEDSHFVDSHTEDDMLQAAIFALTAFFRGGGKVGKTTVEKNYASILSELTLQLGSCHGLSNCGQHEPLRHLLTAFRAFCECVGDLEMGKILARDGELFENEWTNLIGEIAGCVSIKRPKEVQNICLFLTKSLDRSHRYQREAAAAALSEFVRYSGGLGSLLKLMIEVLCRHVSDESSTVRRLSLRGLVQIPSIHISKYTTQVLGVILALLDDSDESVQSTAVTCLMMILESSPNDAVEPILLNLSLRLRNLQASMNARMRAISFAAFGTLSKYGIGAQKEAFLEQVHAAIPRLVLHLHDEDGSVRQACRNTLKGVCPFMEVEGLLPLLNKHSYFSDHRSGYEDFLREFTKQFTQHIPSRIDSCLASTVQAFDAPWPLIQANAIYFSSSMLCLSDNQQILALYHTQVFGMLVNKLSRSPDAVVRATSSAALGLLLKSSNFCSWTAAARFDRAESGQRNHHAKYAKN